jgi:hypothetical protein
MLDLTLSRPSRRNTLREALRGKHETLEPTIGLEPMTCLTN